MNPKQTDKLLQRLKNWANDIWYVYCHETRRIFTDSGVILIFFFAGIAYPILYNLIYWNDDVEDVPVAVVDESHTEASRRFIKA
ncbi:MAG: ABC transporter permease, partial [Paludibacteraceae bacterium]|nr:ABC transporter permease [Paludibacteraceae bacterium]